jgi:hypothetical protein
VRGHTIAHDAFADKAKACRDPWASASAPTIGGGRAGCLGFE